MNPDISRKIKQREKANDVFYTPPDVVKIHIDMIDKQENDIWYDPFKGKGAYYDAYPTNKKEWTEITEGKDFFNFSSKCDIICSNPPYSIIDNVLQKSMELNPRCISYLIGLHNLTTKRIEYMNLNGYYLKKVHLLKVYQWYGMSAIVVFEKGCSNCITYDRTVYR